MKIYLSNYWRKSSIFIVCLSAIITVATAVFASKVMMKKIIF